MHVGSGNSSMTKDQIVALLIGTAIGTLLGIAVVRLMIQQGIYYGAR